MNKLINNIDLSTLPYRIDIKGNKIYADALRGKVYKELDKLLYEHHSYNKSGRDRVRFNLEGKYQGYSMYTSRFIFEVYFNTILPVDCHVHHINLNRSDDRLKNLLACENKKIHNKIHKLQRKYKRNANFLAFLEGLAMSGKIVTSDTIHQIKEIFGG